jgi:hypothetical protein
MSADTAGYPACGGPPCPTCPGGDYQPQRPDFTHAARPRRHLLPEADEEQEFAEPLARYVLYVGQAAACPAPPGGLTG